MRIRSSMEFWVLVMMYLNDGYAIIDFQFPLWDTL